MLVRKSSASSLRQNQPQWWQVFLTLPVLIGLFVLLIRMHLQEPVNTLAQLGILVLAYGFIQLWIRANRAAFMGLEEEGVMRQTRSTWITPRLLLNSGKAVLVVTAITVPMFLIGVQTLSAAVIALVYLVPIAWCANRWGQVPGMSAALTAALAFDFLFIPPYYTFAVGSLEGWLVLAIFMGVAIVVVNRIHAGLSQAREAVFMYELSESLSGLWTRDAVAHTVARYIQQMYQANLVNVIYRPSSGSSSVVVSEPPYGIGKGHPDCVVPILNAWGLIGEIQVWKGEFSELPAADSRLFQNFGSQAARALERTQLLETEQMARNRNQQAIAK